MPQAPRASTPTEVLAGLVDRVTFHNAENGFCVLRVKARGERDLITVLGHAAMISAGEFVQGPCHGNANEHALRACNSARVRMPRQQCATRWQLRFGRSAVWTAR